MPKPPARKFFDPRPRIRPADMSPIGPEAIKATADYFREASFAEMLQNGATVELAGDLALDVKARRAGQVKGLIEEAGGPLARFRKIARQLVEGGATPDGRHAIGDAGSRLFFATLAGGAAFIKGMNRDLLEQQWASEAKGRPAPPMDDREWARRQAFDFAAQTNFYFLLVEGGGGR